MVFNNRVIQGEYQAIALSTKEINSNYQTLGKWLNYPIVYFKFAINGKDNEMEFGVNHEFVCIPKDGLCETPIIVFGKKINNYHRRTFHQSYKNRIKLHVKLDMRHVLAAFELNGFYETFNGKKIYEEDFKGVFIAGNVDPLIWSFDHLHHREDLKLKDENGDGIYECTIILNTKNSFIDQNWKLSKDISSYPTYSSEQILVDALYNMSLEELILNIEEDGTFRTGKDWPGVWTRDISYSAILSLAMLHPEMCKNSLRKKVNKGKIVQDTGTGGAYPVSTDRAVWAIASWEIYLVTGEKEWLQEIYPIIKICLEDDISNVFDLRSGLVKGESSFLDWREQTYPEWMEPADIFESQNLGTNAVHYCAHTILAKVAKILEDIEVFSKHIEIAEKLRKSINQDLWLEDKGYYAHYLYGRIYKMVSPRAEALGAALTVLWDIADRDRQETLIANFPTLEYGVPCIFPQIPDIAPYHNDGIWPFVQAFWSLAVAKVGNETALTHSIDALYRAAALFLSNKENYVANSGDYGGTQVNSDRQLWSVAGNLAIIYKVFYGMEFREDCLVFKPFVPKKYKGTKTLKGFKYRNALLDITLKGYGNDIKFVTLDGVEKENATISLSLTGRHELVIHLSYKEKKDTFNLVKNQYSPAIPKVRISNGQLIWDQSTLVKKYQIIRNGKLFKETTQSCFVSKDMHFDEFQVISIAKNGTSSFASEPIKLSENISYSLDLSTIVPSPLRKYSGYSGGGYLAINIHENRMVPFDFNVEEAGTYAIFFIYSNGNGPINTDNKCAFRSLKLDGRQVGTAVFPQRGKDQWEDWGRSNTIKVSLKPGKNFFMLTFESHNANMNGEINEAMLDSVHIINVSYKL